VCPTAAIEYVEAETTDWLGAFAEGRGRRELAGAHAGAEVG
jgi:hypothetical protein